MADIPCPKCRTGLTKATNQSDPRVTKQSKLFPLFNWVLLVCNRCGYQTVRNTGKK